MDSMTKQRREGEANRPTRAKTGQRKLIKPSWTEFVRLADQAVVAIAGADMITRAERRACGCSRRSRRLDTKWPGTDERQLLRQTKPRKVSEGRRRTRLASSRTGENPPYGMNRGGGGNFGMTRGLFATMLERTDTKKAMGLNRSRLRSTRPVILDTQFAQLARNLPHHQSHVIEPGPNHGPVPISSITLRASASMSSTPPAQSGPRVAAASLCASVSTWRSEERRVG